MKKILLSTKENNTVLTRAFSGRVARGIKNNFIEAMQAFQQDILPYPIQNALTRQIRSKAAEQNQTDYMSMWAGQAASMSRGISAEKLIKSLDKEVLALINKMTK